MATTNRSVRPFTGAGLIPSYGDLPKRFTTSLLPSEFHGQSSSPAQNADSGGLKAVMFKILNIFKILDPGHDYLLPVLDGDKPVRLTFVKRNNPPEKFPGNTDAYPGTTTQHVIRALIDRTKYVDNQIHDSANDKVLYKLRECIYALEARAARRHDRILSLTDDEFVHIEALPTCPVCGHIKPEKHSGCMKAELSKSDELG